MLIHIHSAKCVGIDAQPVTVEVDVTRGIGIHLVGLADVAVKESLLRTVTALQALGFHIPGRKIVINLAPADMHKNGGGYDLPIALGILAASGQKELPGLEKYLIMGELGLDGSVRPVPGAISFLDLAEEMALDGCLLPEASAWEAAECGGPPVFGVTSLLDAVRILDGEPGYEDFRIDGRRIPDQEMRGTVSANRRSDIMDFSQIIGQEGAKRGLEIAAAGGHNVIMVGPPGSGKSSLAKAMSGILPPLTREEAMITSKIYSVAGSGDLRRGLLRDRPFRAPHYSASLPAMVGGGNGDNIVPGEVSLASGGVLFLDEFAQMPKSITEALRGPIEDRQVVISRLNAKVVYPCSFILVAASNPCPCGYYGEKDRCTCTVGQRLAYLGRLSGPIMDRIDLQIWVHPVDTNALLDGHRGDIRAGQESSAAVAARVVEARQRQHRRFGRTMTNAEMDARAIQKFCPLDAECEGILEKVINKMGLSARAFSRIIKLSRTIADLDKTDNIEPRHILEAASYRFLDRRDPI